MSVSILEGNQIKRIATALEAIAQGGGGGVSPTVTVTTITGGHRITITDVEGDHTFDVMDGVDGQDGAPGQDGQDGQDGFSPTVTVTTITGGHRVTITDAEGDHTFDVMDGSGGGGSVTVDDELSNSSTNPVQNKVITGAIGELTEAITPMQTASASDVGKALSPKTVADGKVTEWEFIEATVDPEDIGEAVDAWLDDHPEATTTVQDGSITKAKLDASLAASVDQISDLPGTNIAGSQIVRNLFNPYTVTTGKYVDYTDGSLKSNSSYTSSDFIEVEASTRYQANSSHYAWYTADKTYISGASANINGDSPSNAKYARIDKSTSSIGELVMYKGAWRGASDYEQYKVSYPWLKAPADVDAETLNNYGATFVNMFNKYTAVDGQYVDHSSGQFTSNASYFRSTYIPVKPSTTYKVSLANRYAVYDKDKVYISGANLNNTYTFTTPNNAAFVVICGTPVAEKDEYIIAEEANYPAGYESYGVVVPWIKPKVAKSKYDGKTLVCFGDSITFMDYTGTIAADTGMNVINQGYSSARWAYADDANQYTNAFAMHELIKALTTDDWTTPNTIIGVTGYENQAAQLAALKQIDFSKVDFVSFACGTNDFASATPLDNPSDKYDTEYFMGAIRYCIKTLLTAYPNLKIICASPIYRFWTSGGVVTDDCDTHEIDGKKLKDFCDAIKEVCDECHVAYVDNLKNAGINEFNRMNYFTISDGTHPAPAGRAMIGHRIGAAILQEL